MCQLYLTTGGFDDFDENSFSGVFELQVELR